MLICFSYVSAINDIGEEWYENYKEENFPICRPSAVTTKLSVKKCLNRLFCKQYKIAPECASYGRNYNFHIHIFTCLCGIVFSKHHSNTILFITGNTNIGTITYKNIYPSCNANIGNNYRDSFDKIKL